MVAIGILTREQIIDAAQPWVDIMAEVITAEAQIVVNQFGDVSAEFKRDGETVYTLALHPLANPAQHTAGKRWWIEFACNEFMATRYPWRLPRGPEYLDVAQVSARLTELMAKHAVA